MQEEKRKWNPCKTEVGSIKELETLARMVAIAFDKKCTEAVMLYHQRVSVEMERLQKEALGIKDGTLLRILEVLKPMEELKELAQVANGLEPSPTEIKRRLKYAKNPMEIKQLNKQLTIAYKKYGKRGMKNERV